MPEPHGFLRFCASLVLFLPLIAAAVIAFSGERLAGRRPGWIVLAASGTGFVCSLILFLAQFGADDVARSFGIYEWIGVGALRLPLGLYLDPISLTWALVVTGVGSLIVLYSIAYMEGNAGYSRFFCYLALFLFSMLALVLGENLVLTFLGWEGVGLCSYLLIGFDYHKDSAANAGRKAFIVNRIGDVGFLLGMFWIFDRFGTLSYGELLPQLAGAGVLPIGMALLFLLGAMGKSAQVPLFVWLPDAMAGPTPVSALIHAATMVTAGIYLVCRLAALFAHAGAALTYVAWTGAITALLAGLIALRQTDLKRVLAYSTVSQLGYMFVALGCGAFSAAIFHVVTHAFFKALLFLGAGSVIHAMSGEQDMRKMGGLKDKLPVTYKAMLFGSLALAGIPPFAGFFSKDEILGGAFGQHQYLIFGMGVVTAALTAFYTSRMLTLTFHGASRVPEHIHPHESPPLIVRVLVILKWLSAAGGLVLGVEILHFRPLHWFVSPALADATEAVGAAHLGGGALVLLLLLAAAIAGGFWALARLWYRGDSVMPRQVALACAPFARLIEGRFFVDEFYDRVVVRPLRFTSAWCARFDLGFVDGVYNGTARIVALLASGVRLLQTGSVHTYAFWFMLGAALLLLLTGTR
jgi:NADH-quinone oxidoreductase subunit L